jgi:hypothetical protein
MDLRLNNPEHWRDRAKEARAMAEEMADPVSGQSAARSSAALVSSHWQARAHKSRVTGIL